MAVIAMETIGNWEQRNFHGFHQSRERYDSGRKGPWRFYVTGFDVMGQPNTANVLMADKTAKAVCRVDSTSRLLVLGKWYDSRRWNH